MGSKFLLLYVAIPILGGIIAMSAVIARKVPDAQRFLNKLLPYKATVGAVMLGCFVWNMIDVRGNIFFGFGDGFSLLFGIFVLMVLATELFLGFSMGFTQIAKWIPGDSSPEVKAGELQRKLLPFEVPLGGVAVASGVIGLVLWISPELAAKTAEVIERITTTAMG